MTPSLLLLIVAATTLWMPAALSAAPPLQAAEDLAVRVVLSRAAAWVAMSEEALASIVAEEHLEQQEVTFNRRTRTQEMRSDFLLVRTPGSEGWLPFRDVFEVNGKPVRDRSERLQKLFLESPSTALSDAARISDESSRYNIGSVIRTINVPTFALMLLRPAYARRLEFHRRALEDVSGVATWRVTFVEHARPSIVRTVRGGNVPLEGAFWIDPSSGRVVKALIKTGGAPDPGQPIPPCRDTMMSVLVTYAPSENLGVSVPATMDEWAMGPDCEQLTGRATYTNFRRFQVKTDVQLEK